MKDFVSVIVPAHNEQENITRCLTSLINQDVPKDSYEIIVIDNASTDRTADIVKNFSSVDYLYKENGPVGAVRNYGAKCGRGNFIAFIDGDCVADRTWIREGLKLLKMHPTTAFGGKYALERNASWIERYWLLGLKESSSDKLDLLGGTIFVRKDHFNQVGGFNEDVSSGEDSQLARDLRRNGISVNINQALNVVHLGNAKSIKQFIKRQAWHSENYVDRLEDSIKDPIFVIIILINSLILFAASCLFFAKWQLVAASIFAILALVNILSAKRIYRSKQGLRIVFDYHKVFLLDLLYVLGRTIGISRGLRNKLIHHKF